MKNRVRFFFLFLGLLGALAVHAQINELPRSTPEAEGVPSKAVTALFDSLMALPKTDIHSVVVDGEFVVRQRKNLRFDEAAVKRTLREVSHEFWKEAD